MTVAIQSESITFERKNLSSGSAQRGSPALEVAQRCRYSRLRRANLGQGLGKRGPGAAQSTSHSALGNLEDGGDLRARQSLPVGELNGDLEVEGNAAEASE